MINPLNPYQQVCSHWRSIAISTPALWTYIYVSQQPPHDYAELYLTRSGPNVFLDIDLEMRLNYLHDEYYDMSCPDSQTGRAEETLSFLTSHGASIGRWRSLMVCAKSLDVLFATLSFMSAESAPDLRFLLLRWKTRMGSRARST
jgi:hypothetical protein